MKFLGSLAFTFLFLSTNAFSECLVVAKKSNEPFNANAVTAKTTRVYNDLKTATREYENVLIKSGQEIRQTWHDYLSWNSWAAPILASGQINLTELKTVSPLFYSIDNGFDHPVLMKLRKAIEDYLDFTEATAGRDAATLAVTYQGYQDQIRGVLAQPTCDFLQLEEAVTWLVIMEQAPSLVGTLRASFHQPAIFIGAARHFVDEQLSGFNKTKTVTKSTNTNIGGAQVSGRSTITTNASALLQSAKVAKIRINVDGIVQSPNNVATKGPVRVYTSAVSNFNAFAEIYWDGETFGFTPPQAHAVTRSRIKGVSGPPVIRRIAARKAQEMKRSGEIQSARMIEKQVAGEMTTEIRTALGNIQENAGDMIGMVRKAGLLPLPVSTSLNEKSILMGIFPRSTSGLGATAMAGMPPVGGDFSFSLHENAISKLMKRALSGAHWSDETFASLQEEFTGKNTSEYTIDEGTQRWSASWDWNAPVRFVFNADGLTFVLRFSRVIIEGVEYNVPYETSATFSLTYSDSGISFDRVTPVKVRAINAAQNVDPVVEAFAIRKFAGFFGEEFSLESIARGTDLDQFSSLLLQDIKTENHWVHFGIMSPFNK